MNIKNLILLLISTSFLLLTACDQQEDPSSTIHEHPDYYKQPVEKLVIDVNAGNYLERTAQQHLLAHPSQVLMYEDECGNFIECNTQGDDESQEKVTYWYQQTIPLLDQEAEAGSFYNYQSCHFYIFLLNKADFEENLELTKNWGDTCKQNLRTHFATLDQHLLNPSVASFLIHLYLYEEAQITSSDYLKAYLVATLTIAQHEQASSYFESLQSSALARMSPNEVIRAQKLALQCLNELTEECY